MTRRRVRIWRGEEGQALVEFALVLPLLMMLIIGLTEFSRAWNAQQVLTDTAREALRNAVVANPDFTYDAMLELIRQSLLRASLDPNRAAVEVDGWKGGTGTEASIRIDYEYDFGLLGPMLAWVGDRKGISLSTSFAMRNE